VGIEPYCRVVAEAILLELPMCGHSSTLLSSGGQAILLGFPMCGHSSTLLSSGGRGYPIKASYVWPLVDPTLEWWPGYPIGVSYVVATHPSYCRVVARLSYWGFLYVAINRPGQFPCDSYMLLKKSIKVRQTLFITPYALHLL
jgi:hypothetical protein